MLEALIGRRFWKHGDHRHVWIVDDVIRAKEGKSAFAVLVSEDGNATEDVDLGHLENRNLYVPAV